jgi:hypothetical protein
MPTAFPPLSASEGGVITFVSERDFIPGIHIMIADGTEPMRLTDNDIKGSEPALRS